MRCPRVEGAGKRLSPGSANAHNFLSPSFSVCLRNLKNNNFLRLFVSVHNLNYFLPDWGPKFYYFMILIFTIMYKLSFFTIYGKVFVFFSNKTIKVMRKRKVGSSFSIFLFFYTFYVWNALQYWFRFSGRVKIRMIRKFDAPQMSKFTHYGKYSDGYATHFLSLSSCEKNLFFDDFFSFSAPTKSLEFENIHKKSATTSTDMWWYISQVFFSVHRNWTLLIKPFDTKKNGSRKQRRVWQYLEDIKFWNLLLSSSHKTFWFVIFNQ